MTDIFGLPDWIPFANVFRIGDVLVGAGIVVAIAAGMAPRPPAGIGAPATPKGPTPVPSGTSPE